MDLTGRVAIVTGASRGIGAAITEAFAKVGATVIACAPDHDPADQVAAALTKDGLHVIARRLDVTDPQAINDLAASTHTELGRIDILVNNAGVGAVAPAKPE